MPWSTSELRARLVHLWTSLSPPVKYFYWPFQGGASFVDHLCYICLVLLCFRAHLFVDALWSPAGKRLTSWLSFVMSNCDVVTFPLVSWITCGAWWYQFLIIALFLILKQETSSFVRILVFMSSWNFVLSWDEQENSFITSGPDQKFWIFVPTLKKKKWVWPEHSTIPDPVQPMAPWGKDTED